jgi:predicted DNA-binding transcriptional regulator AlpA
VSLLTIADLQSRGFDLSEDSLRRLEAVGQFPRRVRLSPRRSAWIADEVNEWLAARAAERE